MRLSRHCKSRKYNGRKPEEKARTKAFLLSSLLGLLIPWMPEVFLSNCQHGLLYHRCFESGALELRTFFKGSGYH